MMVPKPYIYLFLLLIISCKNLEPKSDVSIQKAIQHGTELNNQKELFKLRIVLNENFVHIVVPKDSDFEFPDAMAKTEPLKFADFNDDGKKDVLVYLGACGTGGCMYGLFLNQYKDYYSLAFFDYLKNAEFETDKYGEIIIQSSEEIEAYNPSKLQISVYKLNQEKSRYVLYKQYKQTVEE